MTKKDYIKLADAFLRCKPNPDDVKQESGNDVWLNLLSEICTILEEDNPNFNNAKFYRAAGITDYSE